MSSVISTELYLMAQKVLVSLTAPAAIGFPIWYHLKLRWQGSEMGRHVMGYSVVVGFLYIFSILNLFFGELPGQRIISLLITVLMMCVVWWRVVVFVHIYRKTREDRLERERQVRREAGHSTLP